MFVSVFDFSLVFVFLLSLRIALSSGFEFTRSLFVGGLSALTATVLVERYAEVSTFFVKASLSCLRRKCPLQGADFLESLFLILRSISIVRRGYQHFVA